MINTFLKIGGVKSIEDFYKKYASEEDFFNAHPEARHMAKGGPVNSYQLGGSETTKQSKPKYVQDLERKRMLKKEAQESAKTQYENYKAKQLFWKDKPGYTDEEKRAIQNKIDNPLLYNPAGTIASYGTRFEGMSPEEVVSSYGNPLPVGADMAAWGLADMVAPKVGSAALKGLKKVGKAINPMTGMKQIRAAYPNLTENAYAQINASHHPIFYNIGTSAFGAMAPVMNEVITGNGNADPEELMKQMAIGAGAGFVGGNMLRNKGLMKQASKFLPEYEKWDANMAGLIGALDQVPHKAWKNMNAVEREAWLDAVEKQKYINSSNLGNPAGSVDDVRKSYSKYPNSYGDLATPVYEGKYPNQSGSGNIQGDWFDLNQTGYTDVPGFNKQVQELKTVGEFGKRPLEKTLSGSQAEELGNLGKQYSENTDFIFNPTEAKEAGWYMGKPYTGKQAYKTLTPNKYGGTTNKPCYGCGGSYQEGGSIADWRNNQYRIGELRRFNGQDEYNPSSFYAPPGFEANPRPVSDYMDDGNLSNKGIPFDANFNQNDYDIKMLHEQIKSHANYGSDQPNMGEQSDGSFKWQVGGDVKNIMSDVIKNYFGDGGSNEVGNDKPMTTITDKGNQIKGQFVNLMQQNMRKAMAKEMEEQMMGQHQMPDGSMMDNSMMSQGQYAQMGTSVGTGVNDPNPFGANYSPGVSKQDCTDADKMNRLNPRCYVPGFKPQINTQEQILAYTPGSDMNQISTPKGWESPSQFKFNPPAPKPFKLEETIFGSSNRTQDVNKPFDIKEDQGRRFQETMGLEKNFMDEAAKVKPKQRSWSGMDIANTTITAANAIAKWKKEQERKKAEKFKYGFDYIGVADPTDYRGDYATLGQSEGVFRPDSYVPVQFAGTNMGNAGTNQYFAQLGGANPNTNGDEQWLTDEEIEQIKKMGGTITYLD